MRTTAFLAVALATVLCASCASMATAYKTSYNAHMAAFHSAARAAVQPFPTVGEPAGEAMSALSSRGFLMVHDMTTAVEGGTSHVLVFEMDSVHFGYSTAHCVTLYDNSLTITGVQTLDNDVSNELPPLSGC
ncbi:MAG: hypothetical protein ACRD0E_00125 [Acidimicrobiales bacterium]